MMVVRGSNAVAARRLKPVRRGLLRDARGAAAMEFALVAVPLFFLIMGAMIFGANLMALGLLDYATKDAGRQLQIGNMRDASDAAVRTWICGYVSSIVPSCQAALMISVASGATFSVVPAATVTGTSLSPTGFSPGLPGNAVVLQVACNSPFGLGLANPGSFMLTATTVFLNEPQ
jgi:Flp pilus assembly protein TadG